MNKFVFKYWDHHAGEKFPKNHWTGTLKHKTFLADNYEEAFESLKKEEPILYVHSYACVFKKPRIALRS